MKREIIGYNLMFLEYEKACIAICPIGNTRGRKIGMQADVIEPKNIQVLKDVGLLSKWFELVYEEEFKVGDWVIRIEENHGIHAKGKVLKISNILGESFEAEQDSSGSHMLKNVRKATPEEIESAQIKLPKIGNWSGEYLESRSMIKYGYKKLHIETIKELIKLDVVKIVIEGESVLKSHLIQMIKYVNSL